MGNSLNIESVWKYPLDITDEQSIVLPYGARFLSVMEQNNLPTIYACVNPLAGIKEVWHISMRGTGHDIGREMLETSEFLGTIGTHGGELMWHLWLIKEATNV